MNFKRLTAVILLIMMLLTLFTGCKSNVNDEEEAVTDTVVEGEKYEATGTDPQKVDGNTDTDNTQQGTDDTQQGTDDTQQSTDDTQQGTDDTQQGTDDTQQGTDDTQQGSDDTQQGSDDTDDSDGTDSALEGVEEGNFLKIVAYNLRVANDGDGNDILDRMPRFKQLMDELQPDVMGLSECGPTHIEYIEKNIVGLKYKMLYKYRAEDSLEAQPLLYDYTKLELLDDGYFWLSETPDVPSKGWGGKHYRGVTWALLKVKATGRQFLYYSTHLTGSDTAVVGSCNLIVNHAIKLGGFNKIPVFCSGDFNTEPWSAGYNEFVSYFNDVNDYLGFDETYTNGGYTENGGGNHIIDYVMASQEYVVPTKYQVLNKFVNGGAISDHEGLYVECYIK